VHTLYKPDGEETLFAAAETLLAQHGLSFAGVDLVVSGENGDAGNDRLLKALAEKKLAHATRARFKHLCGEYCTASSFALWLAASILKNQTVPAALLTPGGTSSAGPVSTILVANQYLGNNYSLMLLTKK
jgi:3-oxoacyl-[acyl-carrier-protein] synthase II